MNLPRIWGEGTIFAYSGIDGVSLFSDDFTGTLLKDNISIKFYTQERRFLQVENVLLKDCLINYVTSDNISLTYNYEPIIITYASTKLILGKIPSSLKITQSLKKKKASIYDEYTTIIKTPNEVTLLRVKNGLFGFSYSKDLNTALEILNKGFDLDLNKIVSDKLSYYENKQNCEIEEYSELYNKCLSVMKTQIYSPEDVFKFRWSTPDRVPHKKMWLWDSIYHAMGFVNFNHELAQELILSIFFKQDSNGFIPHMVGVDIKSNITQPPVVAYGTWKVYQQTKDLKFLQEVYNHNKLFFDWINKNRRMFDDIYLYTWNLSKEKTCKCDESGMDNSPRFDTNDPLFAIDYSSFMANDSYYMSLICKELHNNEEQIYIDLYNNISKDINKYLWSEVDGFYFDYNTKKKCLHKVWSVSSFLPLFAGITSKGQSDKLVEKLLDENLFNTPLPIPSIAKCDKTYGSDMWRGPVWINYNYLISEGLNKLGYTDLASSIVNKTINCMNKWYKETGTIFEFYDSMDSVAPSCLNRKGKPSKEYDLDICIQSIRDYGWSNTLLLDLLTKNRR